jgi:hypothetical protein
MNASRALAALVLLLALSACGTRPYANPAYASLPRLNLTMVEHGGNAFHRTSNDVRRELETVLAEKGIALAGGPYDASAPELCVDLVDRGPLPGNSMAFDLRAPSPTNEPYNGTVPETRVDAVDGVMGSREDGAHILDGMVYLRRPQQSDLIWVGQVRGIVGYDFVSPLKMAEAVAGVVARALAPPASAE